VGVDPWFSFFSSASFFLSYPSIPSMFDSLENQHEWQDGQDKAVLLPLRLLRVLERSGRFYFFFSGQSGPSGYPVSSSPPLSLVIFTEYSIGGTG